MKSLPAAYTGAGLLDLQLNGYAGINFNGPPETLVRKEFHRARKAIRRRGVSAVLVTLITDDAEQMIARAKQYARVVSADAELAAMYPKLHVEGPFLCGEEGPRGVQRPEALLTPADAPDLIDRINDAADGRVGLVTLAPELSGALELIRRCSAAGICVSIGHTAATNEQLDAAVEAGAKMSTHLGNGSHQFLPRLDNYVQKQLADDRLSASFIADGHHMPLTTLKNFIRAKTPARSILITDAIAGADLGPGQYEIGGGIAVVREDGYVSRPGEANLAGSVATLDRCVINTYLHCDVSFDESWAMASTQPARLLGLEERPPVTVRIDENGFAAEG